MIPSIPFRAVLSLAVVLAMISGDECQAQSVEKDEVELLESVDQPVPENNVDEARAADLIVQRTNKFRQNEDLRALEVNAKLQEAAQYFAQYMARTDKYGHRADGKRPTQRAENHGYELCYIAENIAYQYESLGFTTEELARQFIEGWKNSPEHRANMLSTAAQEIGVAVARSDKTGHWYAVQMFGRPRSAAIEFQIANRTGTMAKYVIAERTFELPPRYARTHMSCQLSTIEFEMPGEQGSPKTVQVEGGELFVLVEDGDGFAVQREAPEEESPEP